MFVIEQLSRIPAVHVIRLRNTMSFTICINIELQNKLVAHDIGLNLENFANSGFTVIDEGCCGVGRNHGQITCLPFAIPCTERDEYIFWDAFHPTEAVNMILAKRAYTGPPDDIYPINLQQLAQL